VYVTANAFHYNYENLQLQTVQLVAGLYIQATANAAKASVNGVELNGVWLPDTHNEIGLGLTWLDAQYGNYFPLGQGNPPNYKGRSLDGSPQYTVNLGYAYRQSFSNGGSMELGARTFFSDAYVVSVVTIPVQYRQPSYHVTDISATYRFAGDKWWVQGYAKNLENDLVVVAANTNLVVPSAPRTYGLRAGFHF
jgi:iron complex outermembrane receptor protein